MKFEDNTEDLPSGEVSSAEVEEVSMDKEWKRQSQVHLPEESRKP